MILDKMSIFAYIIKADSYVYSMLLFQREKKKD